MIVNANEACEPSGSHRVAMTAGSKTNEMARRLTDQGFEKFAREEMSVRVEDFDRPK